MKNGFEFIKLLDKSLLVDYAKNLTECENKHPNKISKELDCIAVYFRDYQGGHYDFEQVIRFDNFSYRINHQPAHITNAIAWMRYVHQHLPENSQKTYAAQCKEYLRNRQQHNVLPDDCEFLNRYSKDIIR